MAEQYPRPDGEVNGFGNRGRRWTSSLKTDPPKMRFFWEERRLLPCDFQVKNILSSFTTDRIIVARYWKTLKRPDLQSFGGNVVLFSPIDSRHKPAGACRQIADAVSQEPGRNI